MHFMEHFGLHSENLSIAIEYVQHNSFVGGFGTIAFAVTQSEVLVPAWSVFFSQT
jgi:hypothetical protein